ncbi:hypothetical protein FPANT_5623 [Fusarium pseudoanthophilum]|uniref:Uncharacterized protein n=1 Tax=Fusarium pseudoanthophilum TaxID=48495 RepID=A0A8H5P7R9_9HYPO|nr:hypothetical protein FPANT_5623 [Fusarium pseudoanthophilum]
MAYENFSRQMSDVSSSFVELMYEANKRGNLPGWPETHKLQSFRSDYNSWVRNHGMRLDSWTHNTAPNDPNEDRIKRSAIRLALSTLNSQVQLLTQDYFEGPEVRTAAGAQGNASSVERSLTTLSRWTS